MDKKEIVGTKDKYDHFPGNNLIKITSKLL